MTTAIARHGQPDRREESGLQQKAQGKRATLQRSAARRLPEFLEAHQVEMLIHAAGHASARLLILIQWRAGLRISEALALEARDLSLIGDRPTLRVRRGKGNRPRLVPVHPELVAALESAQAYSDIKHGPIIKTSRSTAWRWVKRAEATAIHLGGMPSGKKVGTHTLRHSYARHLLLNGIPINYLSRWLGHARITTTLIYLELVPDPAGSLASVP